MPTLEEIETAQPALGTSYPAEQQVAPPPPPPPAREQQEPLTTTATGKTFFPRRGPAPAPTPETPAPTPAPTPAAQEGAAPVLPAPPPEEEKRYFPKPKEEKKEAPKEPVKEGSRGVSGEWEGREVPQTPYVSPTGGEPTPLDPNRWLSGATDSAPAPDPLNWSQITATDNYQKADSDGRAAMLDRWTKEMQAAGREQALKEGSDPKDYENAINNFSDQQLKKIKPFWSLDTPVKFGGATAAYGMEATSRIAGGLAIALDPSGSIDNSDIGRLSIDKAKHERDELDLREPAFQNRADEALDFIKNYPERRALYMQNPKEHPMRDGDMPKAIDDVRAAKGLQMRMKALDDYINSGGQVVPEKPAGVAAAQNIDDAVNKIEQQFKLKDEAYLRAHPLVNKGAQLLGTYAPYIVAGTVLAPTGLGPAAELAMAMGDSYKTGYDSGEAKLEELEKKGQFFTQSEREDFKRDNGTRQAFGTGTFMAMSGFLLGRAIQGYDGLSAAEKSVFQNRLNDLLRHGAIEAPTMGAVFGAQQLTSNLIEAGSDSDDHKTPWYQGVGEAVLSGTIMGAGGTAVRIGRTLGGHLTEEASIRLKADEVKKIAQSLVQSNHELSAKLTDTPITNEAAIDIALRNKVPPEMRDKIRARINLDESAQDQKNVADQIRPQNPQTAAALDQSSRQTQATSTTRTISQADRIAQRKAELEAAMPKAKEVEPEEEAEPEAKEPAAQGVIYDKLGQKTAAGPKLPGELVDQSRVNGANEPLGVTVDSATGRRTSRFGNQLRAGHIERSPDGTFELHLDDQGNVRVFDTREHAAQAQDALNLLGERPTAAPAAEAETPGKVPTGEGGREIAERQQEIRDKVDQLSKLTGETPNKIAYTFIDQEVNNSHPEDEHYVHKDDKRYYRQMLHQLGMLPKSQAEMHPPGWTEKAWAKNTPDELGIAAEHFNEHLSDRLTEEQAARAPKPVVEAPPAEPAPGEVTGGILPPGLIEEAAKTNDPTKLMGLVNKGHRSEALTEEQEEAAEKLLTAHGLNPEDYLHNVEGNVFLAKEPPARFEAHPEAPHEAAYLKHATDFVNSEDSERLLGRIFTDVRGTVLADNARSNAVTAYLTQLRRYGQAMRAAGLEDQIDPDPKKDWAMTKEAPDGTKVHSIKVYLESAAKNEYRKAAREQKKAPMESLQEEAGEGRTKEEVTDIETQAEQDEAERAIKEAIGPSPVTEEGAAVPGTEEAALTDEEKDAIRRDKIGYSHFIQLGNDVIAQLRKQDIDAGKKPNAWIERAVWWNLEDLGVPKEERPENIKHYKGLPKKETDAARAIIDKLFRERHPELWSAREAEARARHEQAAARAAEHAKAVGEQPAVAPPPAPEVLQQPGVPGEQAGGPTEVTGGGEPGREEKGEGTVGPTGELLRRGEGEGGTTGGPGGTGGPPPGGATGGVVEAPAETTERPRPTTGGEREGGAERPGGTTTVAREPERIGEVIAKGPEETGGTNPTAGGGATGIARAAEPTGGAAGVEPAFAEKLPGSGKISPAVQAAVEKIQKGQLGSAVFISDLARELGVSIPQMHNYLKSAVAKGNVNLDVGNWPIATEHQRAGALTDRGEKRLLVRLSTPETPTEQPVKLREAIEQTPGNTAPSPYVDSSGYRRPWSDIPNGRAVQRQDGKIFISGSHTVSAIQAEIQGPRATGEHKATSSGEVMNGVYYPFSRDVPFRGTSLDVAMVDLNRAEPLNEENFGSHSLLPKGWKTEPLPRAPEAETPPAEAPAAAPREQIPQIKLSGTSIEKLIPQIEKAAQVYPEVAKRLAGDWSRAGITDLANNLKDQVAAGIPSRSEKFGALMEWGREFNKAIQAEEAAAPRKPIYAAGEAAPAEKLNWDAADSLANAVKANPEMASRLGLTGLNSSEIVSTIQRALGGTVGEGVINDHINSLRQQMGDLPPAEPPGGAGSSGTLHSMVPGVQAMHGFSGKATDLVGFLRNHSTNTDLQEFARTLNAFKNNLTDMPVRQVNSPVGVMFAHNGELWVSNSAVHDPQGMMAMAHTLQHAIAQRQIAQPQTPEEMQSHQRLVDLHNRFKRSLPADLRDALENEIAPEFDNFKASGYREMDTRYMTEEQKNWLPILWAAHSPENFVMAAFSNGNFRRYLDGVRMADGRTFLEGTRQWARQIFGANALRYADSAHTFSANHPGMPTRFDPNTHNLEGAYPMTPSEKQATARAMKYGLNKGVHEALTKVADLSENPRHRALARELAKIVKKYPQIAIALDERIGGYAGGYNFRHDTVEINPHYEDEPIEHSIIHEVTHALTQGAIDAYQKGQTDLLSPAQMHHISEIEAARRAALRDPATPQVIRDIASMDTYKQREAAMLDLLQRDPALGNKFYGLTDLREFASEVLSNGELQDHLNGIKAEAPHKNLLHKTFNWIRKLLGFRDDTLLGRAFNNTMSLAGDGRRLMEADVTAGGLKVRSSMVMRENLLARRALEERANREGYTGARSVPKDTLRQWLSEWREGNAFSQNARDLAAPHMVGEPRTDGMIRSTPELKTMNQPTDILDHLAKVTGTQHHDTEALRHVVDQAFKDKAITLQQFIQAHQGLNSLDDQTLNRLALPLGGSKQDYDSLASKIIRWGKDWKYGGNLPPELQELITQHKTYDFQAVSSRVNSRMRDLEKAAQRQFKVHYDKLDPKITEDFLKVARMEMNPPPGWSNELIDSLYNMRNDVDDNSQYIGMKKMVGQDKLIAIRNNIGKYFTTSYDVFNDTRWRRRPEFTGEKTAAAPQGVRLAAAEAAVDAWLVGDNRTQYAKYRAEEARNNELRKHPDPTDPVARLAARRAYFAEKAAAMKHTGANFLDYKFNEWEQRTRNKQTHFLQYGHAYNIDDSIMKDLKYMPPEVHQLMGKFGPGADIPILDKFGNPTGRYRQTKNMGDIRKIYQQSMERQAKFIAAHEIADGMYTLGRQGGWLSPTMTPTCSVRLPEDFDHLGKVRGMYTTPEVAAGLTSYNQNLVKFKSGFIGQGIRKMESATRYLATMGNLPRSMGNFHTTYMQPMVNGYYFQGPALKALGLSWKKAGQVFMADLMRQTNPQRQAELEHYIRLGLGDKETNIHEMMNFIQHQAQAGTVPLDLQEAYSHWSQRIMKEQPWLRAGETAKDWMQKLHTTGPFMSKVIQFHMEKAIQRWINDEDVAKGGRRLSDEEIEQTAAKEIRDTNISYSQVSPNIMALRRNPLLGTFLSFGEQHIKAWLNNVIHGWKNLVSDNSRRRWNGAARLGGAMSTLLGTYLIQRATMAAFGISEKDDENFRKLLPPWEQHNAIFYLPKDGNKMAYINMGYTNQASTIYQAFHALLNMRNNPDGIMGAGADFVNEIFKPMYSFGLFTGPVIDVARNQTSYGTQVYNPNEDIWTRSGDILHYLTQRGLGGSVGHLLSGRAYAINDQVTPGGAVYNWLTGPAAEITGLGMHEVSFPERFRSYIASSKDQIGKTEQLFTSPIQRSNSNLSDDQIAALYQKSENARRNAFNDLHDRIEAARFGGMSSNEIRIALAARRYSAQVIDDLMAGRYHPYIPSEGILKNARHNGNYVPSSLFSRRTFHYEEPEEEGEE